MSDPAGTKVSARSATISMVAQGMVAGGVDPAEADRRALEKIRETHTWMRWAGGYAVLSMTIATAGLWRIVRMAEQGQGVVVIAVIVGCVAAIPMSLALYCATQASGEVTKTFLGFLTGTVDRLRGRKEAP